ncbi:MAG: hypothetical protein E6R03_17230 [Hyphomicrobiaceae bacterium]|nr:MAG: hypothetical protein E6R03_17230 [Hyphomicrobiaceae bacterium]
MSKRPTNKQCEAFAAELIDIIAKRTGQRLELWTRVDARRQKEWNFGTDYIDRPEVTFDTPYGKCRISGSVDKKGVDVFVAYVTDGPLTPAMKERARSVHGNDYSGKMNWHSDESAILESDRWRLAQLSQHLRQIVRPL